MNGSPCTLRVAALRCSSDCGLLGGVWATATPAEASASAAPTDRVRRLIFGKGLSSRDGRAAPATPLFFFPEGPGTDLPNLRSKGPAISETTEQLTWPTHHESRLPFWNRRMRKSMKAETFA